MHFLLLLIVIAICMVDFRAENLDLQAVGIYLALNFLTK